MSLVSRPQGRTPFALGEAIFNERRMVDELIENYVVTGLQGRRFRAASEKLSYELFSRVRLWLMTLGRLDNTKDSRPSLRAVAPSRLRCSWTSAGP